LENSGEREIKLREKIRRKIRENLPETLLRGDVRLSTGFLPFGFLIARLHPACGVGGCLDGGGVDITVDCAGDAFVRLVLGGLFSLQR
jgi:hypothetical protein